MKQRKPWKIEQGEMEEDGYVFNDRGEIIYNPHHVIPPVSIASVIKDIIEMEKPKTIRAKNPIKKKYGRK